MGSLVRSTGIVAFSTFVSRIMGFIREMLFANFFGATGSTDAFFVAFRIPNLLRRLVAEGALTISFIPVYTEFLVQKSGKDALALAQKTLSILMLIILVLITAGIIFSPEIVGLFALGFDDSETIALAVKLNRIMFPYLIFVSFVAFSMGILNSHGYFFAPAFSPVLLNAGIILGIGFFSIFFREPLYGVAAGVILGGVLQLILQIPYLVKTGFRVKISIDFNHPGIRKIFRMMAPALFGVGIYQINIFMGTVLASLLPSGSISYLYYSDRLTEIVLGVFIVSIGNVILPEMSKMTAADENNRLMELYNSSIRAALFLSIPAGIALMAVGFPIISVIFMRGEFTVLDAGMTYRALFYSSIGIASVSILRITTPTFYSMKDTKTPVVTAAIAFVLNISLGYILMQTDLKHAGLSLANSISVTVQMIVLIAWLQRKTRGIQFRSFFAAIIKFLLSGIAMALVIIHLSGFVEWERDSLFKRVFMLTIIVIAGGGTYFVFCWITGVKEVKFLIDKIFRRGVR